MEKTIWLPNYEDVLEFHMLLVKDFSEEDPISPCGVKSENLLKSACDRPHTGFCGKEKYTTLFQKAASLFYGLTKNHPFHNGNKRTALVTLIVVLLRNGRRFKPTVSDDDLYDFTVNITSSDSTQSPADDEIVKASKWIKSSSKSKTSNTSEYSIDDFLSRVRNAGAKSTFNNSHIITNNGDSIRISKSTKKLNGNICNKYLRKLGLNESIIGATLDELLPNNETRKEIMRFTSTLKRLAKT